MTGDVRQALAEAAQAELARGTAWYVPTGRSIADALLQPGGPIDRIARERAAAELRKAAVRLHLRGNAATGRHEDYAAAALYNAEDDIKARADELEAQP